MCVNVCTRLHRLAPLATTTTTTAATTTTTTATTATTTATTTTTTTTTSTTIGRTLEAPIPKMSGLVRKIDLFSKAFIFPPRFH